MRLYLLGRSELRERRGLRDTKLHRRYLHNCLAERQANGGTNAFADRVAFASTDRLAYLAAVLGAVLVADA